MGHEFADQIVGSEFLKEADDTPEPKYAQDLQLLKRQTGQEIDPAKAAPEIIAAALGRAQTVPKSLRKTGNMSAFIN